MDMLVKRVFYFTME